MGREWEWNREWNREGNGKGTEKGMGREWEGNGKGTEKGKGMEQRMEWEGNREGNGKGCPHLLKFVIPENLPSPKISPSLSFRDSTFQNCQLSAILRATPIFPYCNLGNREGNGKGMGREQREGKGKGRGKEE